MLEKVSEWTVEDLGVVDDWVYDIEVEDCHNFFANDILVHNSIYLNFAPLIDRVIPEGTPIHKTIGFLDKFVKKYVDPFLKAEFQGMANYLNSVKNTFSMKREAIADKVIWRGKKNYVLQVYDSEGVRYQKPKIKVAGLESVRSAVPKISRKALVNCYEILLNKTQEDLIEYVKTFKHQFMTAPIVDVAFPRGVNDMEKWKDGRGWIKGSPIHVKAAIAYNNLLHETKLDTSFPMLKNGDKIRFVYLKNPNPLHSNAIAFSEILHSEFNLSDYVDYEAQYEKTFKHPLESVAQLVGFDIEFKPRLLDLFSNEDAVNTVSVPAWGEPDKKSETKVVKERKICSTPVPRKRRKEAITLLGMFDE